jgi:hypothetical protein
MVRNRKPSENTLCVLKAFQDAFVALQEKNLQAHRTSRRSFTATEQFNASGHAIVN